MRPEHLRTSVQGPHWMANGLEEPKNLFSTESVLSGLQMMMWLDKIFTGVPWRCLIALYYPATRCLHAIELEAGLVAGRKGRQRKCSICGCLSLYRNPASVFFLTYAPCSRREKRYSARRIIYIWKPSQVSIKNGNSRLSHFQIASSKIKFTYKRRKSNKTATPELVQIPVKWVT